MPDWQDLLPDELARELQLNPVEYAYVQQYRIGSTDELHARLSASPSLGERRPGLRYAELLGRLEPLLSDAYRLATTEPPIETEWGAALGDAGALPPLGSWPGADLPADLNAEAAGIDLLGNLIEEWPLRDQGASRPTCVPYAVNACLELQALKAGGGMDRLGSVFLFQRIRSRINAPPGAAGSRLSEVFSVLPVTGVCREALWPDGNDIATIPNAAAIQDGLTRQRGGPCTDLGWNRPNRPTGVARVVLEQLRQGRPIAITIPTFAEQGFARSNWTDAFARVKGYVLEKEDHWIRVGGHAVCILGFQPATKDALGGYFVFRNSWGDRFATQPMKPPANPGKPFRPTVPGIGYGVIGASEIENYVTEIMVFP